MQVSTIPEESLRQFVRHVFLRLGYPIEHASDAADVLLWASLRGVDTHGIRNLKSYYADRTLDGQLNPAATIRIEHETPHSARLDGDSGLGLVCACQAMRLAIAKCRDTGVGMVCMRNAHHLGPAGYFAHMAARHGMLGACLTGHFFGKGHATGVAPLGSILPMFSTNPLSFAAPCGRHPAFVLDMSTAVATVNRIEMYGHEGRVLPAGWACDPSGRPTTDPLAARVLLPLGGTSVTSAHKGWGLGLAVSVLSGVLSGSWARVESAFNNMVAGGEQAHQYDQPTMGHFFAAVRVDAFQPLDTFQAAMDAMIDALHATPTTDPNCKVCYPGEIEARTAAERGEHGVPVSERLFTELKTLADRLDVEMPPLSH